MSVILATLVRGGKIDRPKLKVLCDGCGRIYVTTVWPSQVAKQRSCVACQARGDRGQFKATTDAGKGE